MDREELAKQFEQFRQAFGRTQFAFRREKGRIRQSAAAALEEARNQGARQAEGAQKATGQTLLRSVEQLKTLLSADLSPSHPILKAAEYLAAGGVELPQLPGRTAVPYIVPLFGRRNLALTGGGRAVDAGLKSLILSVLDQTAEGQVQVSVYNPDLTDTFSCFLGLDQLKQFSDRDAFLEELERVSADLTRADELMKGKFATLLQLREHAAQAVGQLRLVVVTGENWYGDKAVYQKVKRLCESALRAGVVFLLAVDDPGKLPAGGIGKTTFLRWDGGSWRPEELPGIRVHLKDYPPAEVTAFLEEYARKAENSTAVTIPFDRIEDTGRFWTDSSAEGLTFHLGMAGLDVISLRLGDEKSQLHHALITGAPGKGKSNLLEVMLHSMCCRYSPDELELYLLDFKDGLTFQPYSFSAGRSWLPHARVLGLESARDFGVAVLEYVEETRANRALKMNSVGAASVAMYRKKFPEEKLPRIVVVIDEYQKLLEVQDPLGARAAELLENIARQGRACGIHLVLASQTVARGGALLGRDGELYAAFPVRIALQNNLQESYATFVQGNDAAAKLTVRGEAVLNVNYGAVASNQKFVVAYAEPKAMAALRARWCADERFAGRIPGVFGRNDQFRLPDAIDALRTWRSRVKEQGAAPVLPCGMALSVTRDVVAVTMADNAGRNVAILGSGDGDRLSPDAVPPNYAVGLLENMALALALQHPEGDARFVLVNGLEQSAAAHSGLDLWLRLMERFGFPVETVSAREAPAFFVRLASELKGQTGKEETVYLLGMALDRCPNMGEPVGEDIFTAVSGAESFQELLKSGPAKGLHVIAWWSSAAAYRDHIGFGGDGYLDTKILLRVDDATAKNVLGPFVSWQAAGNRLLLHDATDLEGDMTLIPMAPCTPRDCGRLEAAVWD